MSAINDLLRAMRLKKGMTQEKLANEIGIAHNTYIENPVAMRLTGFLLFAACIERCRTLAP